MTPRTKLLEKVDVPEQFHPCLDFENQTIVVTKHNTKLAIQRTCPDCGNKDMVGVQTIRHSLKLGNFTGRCLKCVRKLPLHVNRRRGSDSPAWRGGKTRTPQGYVKLRCPQHPFNTNGYVFEHRLVAEQTLGRYLEPQETVHHKNGIKDDNRPENLEVWSGKHPSGQRLKDLTTEHLESLLHEIQSILSERR